MNGAYFFKIISLNIFLNFGTVCVIFQILAPIFLCNFKSSPFGCENLLFWASKLMKIESWTNIFLVHERTNERVAIWTWTSSFLRNLNVNVNEFTFWEVNLNVNLNGKKTRTFNTLRLIYYKCDFFWVGFAFFASHAHHEPNQWFLMNVQLIQWWVVK